MNLNFGDPLIDARTRAFDEYEGVNEKLNFSDDCVAEIKNAKKFVLMETSYLPHLYELQSFISSKPFFTTSNFKLFKHQETLLCLCADRLDFSSFLKHLLPSLQSSACTVSTISFYALNSYKTEATLDSCVLRCLSKVQGILPLDSPNFVTGLTASIATYGKFYEFPFTSYILYTNDLDQDCCKNLTLILDKLGLSLNLKPQASNASSLYI